MGALATLLHDAVFTPLDAVKQRLQLGFYAGASHALRDILCPLGRACALYRSYPTTLLMNVAYVVDFSTIHKWRRCHKEGRA